MKKIITLMLALTMILAAVPAGSETIEEILAPYTDAELQSVIAIYGEELLRRTGKEFILEPGMYIVGVDIPELAYRVETVDGEIAAVWFFENEAAILNWSPFYSHMFDPDDMQSVGRIYLTTDNVIEIDYHPLRFIPYTGVK